MKILLATDGSANADAAANLLSQLPTSKVMDIVVLSVVQLPELHHVMGGGEIQKRFKRERESQLREGLLRIESKLASLNATITQQVREGHPGKVILEEAERQVADLVVVGAVGSSLLDRLLLGSTSEFVATHAKCSVLVARTDESVNAQRRLLVPFDASPQSESALAELVKTGWGKGLPIDVVYVLSVPSPNTKLGADELWKDVRTQAENDLDRFVSRPDFASLEITPHVLEAPHVGKALCKFATEHDIKLVVMGSTGHGLLARFLLGSVSRYLLRNAPCSVWINRSQPENESPDQVDVD